MSDPLDPAADERFPLTAGTVEPSAAAGAPPPSLEPEEETGRPALQLVRDVVETLVLTFVIFFVVQGWIAQPFQVQQPSMERTFEPGQFVLVDKLTPRWDAFKRGDVVIFQPPEEWTVEHTPFIKRVIAVAGDTLELVDGRVVVEGTALDESYTYRDDDGSPGPTEPERGQTKWTLGPGEIFVMGDHRQASLDSRAFGPIEVGDVIGRVSFRYWPLASAGVVSTPVYGGIPAAAGLTLQRSSLEIVAAVALLLGVGIIWTRDRRAARADRTRS